jgi:hypothetical protein
LLLALRDTLTTVEAALGDFNHDLRSAGPETVLSRSARLRRQCGPAALALARTRTQWQPATRTRRTQREASALITASLKLEQTLREECERGFRETGPGSWADSLRAWGPYRSTQIQRGIRLFGVAADRFAAAAGFKLEPKVPKK